MKTRFLLAFLLLPMLAFSGVNTGPNSGGGFGSSGNIYYVDPKATGNGAKGTVDNPYNSLNTVASLLDGSPSVCFVAPGTNYFGTTLTNCSIIGSGTRLTYLIWTNQALVNSYVNNCQTSVGTNGLMFKGYTVGFSYGGVNCTNFGSGWYVPSGANITNCIIQDVDLPFDTSAFDGIVSDGANESFTFINNNWDAGWDLFNFNAAGIKTIRFIGGTYTCRGITNIINPLGNHHTFQIQQNSDGTTVFCNGTKFYATGLSNGLPFSVVSGSAKVTSVNFNNCIMHGGTNSSIKLSGGSLGTGYNLNFSYSGGIIDSNGIIWAAPKWTNGTGSVGYYYLDWSNNLHSSSSIINGF